MKRLLIVHHSPSPNTRSLLAALLRGASHPDASEIPVLAKAALAAGPDDVLACDGILLLTPENLGYMSGAMKDFFDRSYYPLLERMPGLPCAIVIRAGHDGTGARRAIESILTGLRWKLVHAPLVLRGEWRKDFVVHAEEVGMSLAIGLATGIY